MNVQWMDTADAVARFVDEIDGIVAVDTESDHFHAYQARVCLIQACTHDAAALIDPLALDQDALRPFLDMLANPSVEKVFHAGRNDMGEFDRDYQVNVEGFFDTQIACRFLNKGGSGLSWLLEDFFDVKTSKKYQRFDWTTRPIPEEPAEYAATDVLYLLPARERLLGELEEAGWLEPFRQQCQYVASATRYSENPFDPEGWRRIKSKKNLDGRTRSVLAALYQWRHELCVEVNRAALHVLKDGALMRLATKTPTTVEKLQHIGGISRFIIDEHAEDLLKVIAEAKNAEPPPARLERRSSNRPSDEVLRRVKIIKKWRNAKASDLGIPTEFIATNSTIDILAEDPPATLQELEAYEEILPWHVERFGKEILGRLRA